MKRIAFLIMWALSFVGVAQEVDNFDVGPYEVDYYGVGDFKFRLRPGIDLYKYYGLKKDTAIAPVHVPQLLDQAVQVGLFYMVPPFAIKGSTNVYGVEGKWKKSLAESFYFNAGLSLAFSVGKYNASFNELDERMFHVGVPISVEYSKLSRQNATVYVGVGIVPTVYAASKAKIYVNKAECDADKKSGFLVAPRVDFGGYIPLEGRILSIGVTGQFNANCSNSDGNIFKERIGRVFIGAHVGLIL